MKYAEVYLKCLQTLVTLQFYETTQQAWLLGDNYNISRSL